MTLWLREKHGVLFKAFAWASVAMLYCAATLFAQQPAVPNDIEYQKIYVPENRPTEWPRYGFEFAPQMQLDDFGKLITQFARSQGIEQRALPLRSLTYRAQLEGRTLQGSAQFDLGEKESTEPGFVSLKGTNLFYYDQLQRQSTMPNLWVGANGDQVGVFLREFQSMFTLDWSYQASLRSTDELTIDLDLTFAPQVDFYLDLPSKWHLDLREGVTLDVPDADATPMEGMKTWHLSPQWEGKLAFSLVPSDRLFQSDTVTATQSTRYDVRDNLCEVTSQILLHSPPQGALTFSIPKGMVVTGASVNRKAIEPLDLQELSDGKQTLELPQQLFPSAETATVSIQGMAPMVIGDYSRIDLPIVVLSSQPTESHVVAAELDAGINLSYCILKNAQEVEYVPHNSLGRPNLRFRLFDENAEIGLQLFRQSESLHTALVHKVTVNDLVIQSDSVIHIADSDETTDHIELPLSPGWRVETVVQFPDQSAVSWEETARDEQRVLRVENRSAISDLQISLRRTRENDFGNLRISDFRPFALAPGVANLEWVSVKPAAGFDLRLEPEGQVARKAIQDAPAEIIRLFGSKWQTPAFEIRGRSDLQHLIRVTRKRATYDAEIDVQVRIEKDAYRELAAIRLNGSGLLPETLLVWSTQRWSNEVKWTTPDLEPIRWTPITTSAAENPNQREPYYIYELTPPSDSSFPLILRGTFPQQSGDFNSPLLLAVPSAEPQSGMLTLTSPKACQLTADPILLRKVYLDARSQSPGSDLTRYEYRPLEIRRLAENIRGLIACDWQLADTLPELFATKTTHSINLENDGRQRMTSRWSIISHGPGHASITLPEHAELELIQWQGQPWSRWKQHGQQIDIEIPDEASAADLEVHYQIDPATLYLMRAIRPSFATASFPTSAEEATFTLGSRLVRMEYPSPRWSSFGERLRLGLWSGMFQGNLSDPDEPNLVPFEASQALPAGTLWIVHRDSLRLISIFLFVVAICIGAILFPRFPRNLVACLLGLVAIVPWLPDLFAPLTSASFLGIALGGIAGLVMRPRTVSSPTYAAGSTLTVTSLLLALAAGWMSESVAPVAAQEAARPVTVYPVLIPIDANRKPVGQAYLPLPFYERLNAVAEQPDDDIPRSIIEGMSYEISLIDSVELASEIAVTTNINVVTTKTNQTIRLPFDAQLGVSLSTAVDQINSGVDASSSILPNPYSVTTGELVLPLKEVGQHTIVIKSLLPVSKPGDMPLALHIETPPQVSTAVTIADSMRMGSPKIQFNDREISLESSNIRQTIPLGMVEGFDLQWRSSELQARFEFRELDLLQFTEDDIELRVRLMLTNRSPQIGPILLNVDSRLKLDMQQSLGWTAEVKSNSLSASTRTYAINLLEGATPIDAIDLRFSLDGAQQVGQLRFPNVEVANGTLQRRWVAVAANSQLQVGSQAQSRVNILSQDDFLREWNEDEPNFRFAVAVATVEPLDWLISTRPIATRGNADLRYRLQFDSDGYNFDLKAQIETYSGQAKQYVVEMIPGCEIQSVGYLVDGLLRPTQWHYDAASGELGVMLLSDVSGLQELSINGRKWLPVNQTDVSLPPIKIRDVHTQSCRVQLVRDHSVLVRPMLTTNLIPLQDEAADPMNDELVQVGQWEVVDSSLPIDWQVIPNDVLISGDMLTITDRVDGAWKLNWVGKLEIRSGSVGYLQWLVPKEVELDVDSIEDFEVHVRELPDKSAFVYTLVPQKQLGSYLSFDWSGKLKTSPGRRVQFAPLLLIGQPHLRQLAAIPREVDQQEILWSSLVLRATTPSERWLTANTPDTHQLLIATRPDYTCELIQRANPTGNPLVDSLETTIHVDRQGNALGVIRAAILPQGNGSVEFTLPPTVDVMGASVDYTRLWNIEPRADRVVTIPLKSSSLPQMVELAFRSRLIPDKDLHFNLDRPRLTDANGTEELLRVSLPLQWTIENVPHLDRMAWSRQQVTSAFRLKDASRDTQSGISSVEIQRWNQLRMEQAFAALFNYQELLRKRGESPENTREQIASLLGDNASDVETWEVSDRSNTSAIPVSLTDATDEVASERFHYFRETNPFGTLSIRVASSRSYSYWPPIATSMLALLGIGLIFFRHPILNRLGQQASHWMVRNPQVCGVLAGLFWWLFLPPHFIGLLLIAAVLWASLPMRSAAVLGRN
ncbi:hypothetical protein [Bremerella cremea]|uniref:hypothetical protein n=1 Tax=Bremerella cremea TaxID=1031537 RepID=UPI0031EB9694